MKKILIIALILIVSTSCATHMTAVKYVESQRSYCPPNQKVGFIHSSRTSNNFSYSKPKHKNKRTILKSLKDNHSYIVPKSHYKNGQMKHNKHSLPKYIKRR